MSDAKVIQLDQRHSATLYCQDATEFLRSLSENSVDMVLTSPPYDALREYKGFALNLPTIGKEVSRVLKPGGVAVMVIQDQTKNGLKSLTTFRTVVDWVESSNGKLGLWECLIYSRHGAPSMAWKVRFRVDHEYIPIFVKGRKPKYLEKTHMAIPCKYAGSKVHGRRRLRSGEYTDFNVDKAVASTKCCGTIIPYAPSKSEPHNIRSIKCKHPATFPDKMAEDFIRCFCPPGGLVVDPFAGSGTSLVASTLHGRHSAGSDVSMEYCEIAKARFEHHGLTLEVVIPQLEEKSE